MSTPMARCESTASCRIAAVVVTFNRQARLEECLKALLGQTRPLDEILVIDNDSQDGTDRLMATQFASSVTYIRLAKNCGGAGGFHEGMRLAYEKGYDWVWVMDDDAEPSPTALEELARCPHFAAPEAGALASLVVDHTHRVEPFHHRICTPAFQEQSALEGDKVPAGPVNLDTNSFVGLLVKATTIREVGLPRKEFFVLYDDTEYTFRISRRSKIVLVPQSVIVHKDKCERKAQAAGANSSQAWHAERWRWYYDIRNQTFFFTRYARGRQRLTVLSTILEKTARRLAHAFHCADHKYGRSAVVLLATWDGFLGRLRNRYTP